MKSFTRTPVPGGCRIFLLIVVAVCLAPAWLGRNAYETNPRRAFRPPDAAHWCGTDEVGRDLLSRMAVGARTSLVIGLLATLLSGAAGTLLGLLAGYFGGKTDLLISRLIDVALAFPSLLLAIGISVVLPPGGLSVVVAISMTGWASFARLLRSRTIVLKRADYAVAGKVLGSSSFRILFRHVFPNCAAVLVVSASLKLGSFMLAESGLSFLGLGVPPPYPSLGWMIASGRDYLITAPWVPLLPGILIAALVLAANLAGESLEKHLDPKRRGGR